MNRQQRGALLWGVVAALSFLVLLQGYELLTDQRVAFAVKFGVGAVVGVVATVLVQLLRERLPVTV